VIPRYFVIAERDHELQNPTSVEKLVLLGDRLRLGPGSRVLDIASGRGGPALVLARSFGCTVEGIEIAPEFRAAAVERAAAEGLADRLSFRLGDASREAFEPGVYDVALCLGATFVFGGLGPTLEALRPCVRTGGHLVVGEPYWRTSPPPADYDDRDPPYTSLEATVTEIESHDVSVVGVIAASQDDWDRYETLHWRAVEEWLAENGADPDAADVRSRHERGKRDYLGHGRDLVGWAIFVCRTLPTPS
jgi:SAM-dependent methyltransferase